MTKMGDHNGKADPRSTTSDVGRAYWAFHDRKFRAMKPEFLPWVSIGDLEAIEALANMKPADPVAELHQQMIDLLTTDRALDSNKQRDVFKDIYDQAVAAALPVKTAYLRHAQVISSIAYSHSLAQVELETLTLIDRTAHTDPAFACFANDLAAKLGTKAEAFDVIAYSQFFEVYGEALTLLHLRSRPGLQAKRVEESKVKGEGRPDFECTLNEGPPFYIEVKSLDIVGGEFRNREMMDDGLERQAKLEKVREADQAKGRRVSMVEGEIAPYKAVGQNSDYDCRSLKHVIDTLREKCRSAFKASQFKMGPTFALAIVDRLIVPGGRHALAPYYYAPEPASCCLTGVLWHLAYGRIGTPVFRAPDFEGKPSFESNLTTDGLYRDSSQPFLGQGLIVLDTHCGRRVAYGLSNPETGLEQWTGDDTEQALDAICDARNDAGNSCGWELSDMREGGSRPPK